MDFTPNQSINNLNLELEGSPHVEEFSNDDLAEQLNMFSNPYFFDFEPVNLFPNNFYGSLPQKVNSSSISVPSKYPSQQELATPPKFTASSNVPVSAIPKQEPLEDSDISVKLPQGGNQNPYLAADNFDLLNASRVMQLRGKDSASLLPLSNATEPVLSFFQSNASQNQQKIPSPPSLASKRASDSSSLDLSSLSAGNEGSAPSTTAAKRDSTSAQLSEFSQSDTQEEQSLVSVPSTPVTTSAPTIKRPKTDFSDAAIRNAAEEDKRRRNTAASARFRIKKKQKEQQLERTAKELSEKMAALEARIGELEMENTWLKGLIRPATNF
ncbi:transcription factor Zip1 [Schizosaccharomyces cryophilus OY26]|uniref:Transcription factor Zip1 n=1 Tax=Schizosaccharomyces cryophilus (strain OY26 / ATCC MYA-4695 / CBS 11777 / NBRC 106824 / NRRL Y48691) TaxID=653667 RepID=S9X4H0_SCHCR|nr:transcription factor Zip1 [Schizosaccharomyces cryophilus OY26]EPY51972.1 transcription factor Zip1 [Schizosaccharomyces cryophilus OY26]